MSSVVNLLADKAAEAVGAKVFAGATDEPCLILQGKKIEAFVHHIFNLAIQTVEQEAALQGINVAGLHLQDLKYKAEGT